MKDKNIIPNFIKCLRLLFEYSKCYIFLHIVCAIMLGLLPVVSLLIMQRIINSLQMSSSSFREVLTFVVVYILIDILTSIISSRLSFYTTKKQHNFSKTIELEMLNKAASLTMEDFEDSEMHNIISRARTDASAKIINFFGAVLSIFKFMLFTLSSVAIIATYRPIFILIVLVIPVINCFFSIRMSKLIFNTSKNRTTRERKIWYLSHLLYTGISFKEIKLFHIKDYFIEQYNRLKQMTIDEDINISKKSLKILLFLNISDHIVTGLIFILLLSDAFAAKLLIGDVVTYNKCLSNIKTNLQSIFSQIDSMARDSLFINEYFKFHDLDRKSLGTIKISGIQRIRVCNLSFKYSGANHYVLKNISFEIRSPEKIVLIGRNGSGKTTLFKLLLGFYSDYEGDIFINDINLKSINLDNYYEHIGCVFQDYFRFEATVRENVGFGNLAELNNDSNIQMALESAGFNKAYENGLDTFLGSWFDNAEQLSGGEWQRIALARAFIKNADFYILDEPDSSLDPKSEYEVLERYVSIMHDKISIFTSHKLSALDTVADRIFVFENGYLVENGRRDYLLQKEGLYASLFSIKHEHLNDL